jgi:hypothetical protein
MVDTRALWDDFHPYRGAGALLGSALVLALLVRADDAVSPLLAILLVVFAAFFLASSFERVYGHPTYSMVEAGIVTALLALWYVEMERGGFIALAFLVLMAIAFVVEAYNYRCDDSLLRFGS